MSINYTNLIGKVAQVASNSNEQRNELVKTIVQVKPTSKAHLWYIICTIFETEGQKPAVKGVAWADMSQGERDILTVYAQAGKALGLVEN